MGTQRPITKDESLEENVEKDQKEEKKDEEKSKAKPQKRGKARIRSKKYKEVAELIDRKNIYEMSEALELVKKTNLAKFDGSVEAHIRLLGKSGKSENVRGTFSYPHSTGKKITVVILDDATIAEIEKTKKADFDIALATPDRMAQVAKLARILGPKGKMPNPKSGTVTSDPEKTKKELEGGLTEYKTDSFGIIHQVIGKLSSDNQALEENLRSLIAVLPKDKIASAYIAATMGPSVKFLAK